MRYILFFILSILSGISGLPYAEAEVFSISALVVDDAIPPSTPTVLTVVPIAATQINVTWSAATDDYLLGGYVVLRDSTPIATTTLTTFSDAGLTAETLYSYEVYAFDAFYNVSTTSNALATTTLAAPVAPPVTPTPTSNQVSGTQVFRLVDFAVTTGTNDAHFIWETSKPARYTLRWGRSDAYDAGYIANDVYRTKQQTSISDLEPGTVYLYELVGYDASDDELILSTGEFTTAAREFLTPQNVQFFTAGVMGTDVRLDWVSPDPALEAKVRVVRSHLGYPTDPYDGAIVYEGQANSYIDEGALTLTDTLYYAAFVIAADGSVSSGAVLMVAKDDIAQVATTTVSSTEPVFKEPIPLPEEIFAATEIHLIQGDTTHTFFDTAIKLNSTEAFMISIPYETLPAHLKSIVVTLFDPANHARTYSFLLRINKDRTAYEATIAPLLVVGNSQLQIEIFEYEHRVMARYVAPVTFFVTTQATPEVVFPDKLVDAISPFFSSLLILLLLLFIPTTIISYRHLT